MLPRLSSILGKEECLSYPSVSILELYKHKRKGCSISSYKSISLQCTRRTDSHLTLPCPSFVLLTRQAFPPRSLPRTPCRLRFCFQGWLLLRATFGWCRNKSKSHRHPPETLLTRPNRLRWGYGWCKPRASGLWLVCSGD